MVREFIQKIRSRTILLRYFVVLLWFLLMSLTVHFWPHYTYKYLDIFFSGVAGLVKPDWPQAVVIITIIFVCSFYDSITKWIDRIERTRFGDKEFYTPIKENRIGLEVKSGSENLLVQNPEKITEQELRSNGTYETIIDQFKAINNQFDSKNAVFRDKEGMLKLQLASFQFFCWCERQYNLMWGSQILLLEILQRRGPSGMAILDLDEFFRRIKDSYKEHYSNFYESQQYVHFLINSGVIKIDVTSGAYVITQKGIDFLCWLVSSGHSKLKDY